MVEATEKEFTWEPFVGRGVLGGIMGMLLASTIAIVFVAGFNSLNLNEDVPIFGVLVLVGGSLYGVGIGYIIYLIAKRRASQPPTLMRILIGAGVALVFGLFTKLANSDNLNPVFEIGYALIVGGVTGLMSRRTQRE